MTRHWTQTSILGLLRARWMHGHQTTGYPDEQPTMPELFRGLPELDASRCGSGCQACVEACPTEAISIEPLRLDLGRCLFCPSCTEACPSGAIRNTQDFGLAARAREALVLGPDEAPLAAALDRKMQSLFGRSLKLRQVSAGGCNGCEAELVALGNVVFDLGRFGIQFVASPRHADGVLITGPVTVNMESALRATIAAVPEPRIVIAAGACAISGGPFRGSSAQHDGVPKDIAVDLWIPGCPPHPLRLLDALLRMPGKIEDRLG